MKGVAKFVYVAISLVALVAFFTYNEYIVVSFSSGVQIRRQQVTLYKYKVDYEDDAPATKKDETGTFTIDPCDVVVMVLTGSVYHESRVKDIQQTYMKHACQTDSRKNVLFISDVADDDIPTVAVPCGNGYDHSMCCKVINGWRKAMELYPKAKYYIQVDDDSYLVMNNLMRFLATFNYKDNIYTGNTLYLTLSQDGKETNAGRMTPYTPEDIAYAVGWFGVISRPALVRIFENQLDKMFFPICDELFWPDLVVGVVFRAAGITLNTNYSGFHMGWDKGGTPKQYEGYKNSTVAIHAYHDTTSMYKYEKFYYSNATEWPSS